MHGLTTRLFASTPGCVRALSAKTLHLP